MRKARMKVTHLTAVYHCISRIVGEEYLLDDLCQETFRCYMRQQAEFAGLQMLTDSLMTNHVHILVRVPKASEVSDAELLERVQALYGPEARETLRLREDLERGGRIPRQLRERLLQRMGDVSAFRKELKQRFSRWYNQSHERFGTLWAEGFKRVLVEDASEALRTVAAYIDLNSMRAGLARPWDCGSGISGTDWCWVRRSMSRGSSGSFAVTSVQSAGPARANCGGCPSWACGRCGI